ncbi:MAG: HAD family hydrolase [Bacteroidota bacterium]
MATNFLKNIDNTWTLFLDRDGVINKRIFGGYVTNPSEFEFLPAVLESIKFFSSVFNKIIIVTNQQGVGKGIMTEKELIELHKYMVGEISKAGGRTDAVYYCTQLATTPINCRKPGINMALVAQKNFNDIDFSKSIMVGDSQSDIEFGNNAGMKTVFVANDGGDSIPTDLSNMIISNLHELKTKIQTFNP